MSVRYEEVLTWVKALAAPIPGDKTMIDALGSANTARRRTAFPLPAAASALLNRNRPGETLSAPTRAVAAAAKPAIRCRRSKVTERYRGVPKGKPGGA